MTAIPGLTTKHVRAAIKEIRRHGVPRGRGSTRFCVQVEGIHLPPKYVVALAVRSAIGRELRPDEFSGGAQTNTILEGLGFRVQPCTCGGELSAAQTSKTPTAVKQPTVERPATTAIVRVVARGRTPEDPKAEERILLDVFGARWPTGKAKFVLTPGGFVHGTLPRSWNGQAGWNAAAADLQPLVRDAERQLARVVTERVFRAAAGKADVLTIGIDLFNDEEPTHAELVAVFDLRRRRVVRWTGKSYPTSRQERALVHVVDLDSHLLKIAGERVLVLGCHDLNMFSPRGHANQSPDGLRRKRCDAMKRKVSRFKPTVVLQHPHSTDTPNIWRMPWLSLAKTTPSIKTWASGLAYYTWGGRRRAPLGRVQALTRSDDSSVVDVVVRSADYA